MVDNLTWITVPTLELSFGHLGRHIKAAHGTTTVKGVLVAVMLGKHEEDGHGFCQLVITTGPESIATINSCGPDASVELSLEKAL